MNQKGVIILYIFIIFFAIVALGIAIYLFDLQHVNLPSNNKISLNKTTNVKISPNLENNNFFLNSLPKPLDKVTLSDIPNDKNITSAVSYNNKIWFTGDGSLMEYDTNTKKIINYSNPSNLYCSGDLVVISNFLFATCSIPDKEGSITSFSVYKFNLTNNKLMYIYNKSNGLLNGDNLILVPDKDTLWVGTFNGLAEINIKTNSVKFYTSQLNISSGNNVEKPNYSIDHIFVDGIYVWVDITHSSYLQGGLVLINTNTGKITSFSNTFGSAFKSLNGGVEIFSNEGITVSPACMILNYNYSSNVWKTVKSINAQQIADNTNKLCDNLLSSNFPGKILYSTTDSNNLTQLQLANNLGVKNTYEINGRANIEISPIINGKRYILTNSTIDILTESLNLPQIFIKLKGNLVDGYPYNVDQGDAGLIIDQSDMTGLVVDSGCGPSGSCGFGKLWLVNLKSGSVLKSYSADNLSAKIFNNQNLLPVTTWTMVKKQNNYVVSTKDGTPVLNINVNNYNLNLN